MSLQNLLKIRQLDEHVTDAAQLGRLLGAAERGIVDAQQDSISLETRTRSSHDNDPVIVSLGCFEQ